MSMNGFEFYVVIAQAIVETLAVLGLYLLIKGRSRFFVRLRGKWLVAEMLWRWAAVWSLACMVGSIVFAFAFRWYTASIISMTHVVVLCLYVCFVVPYVNTGRRAHAHHHAH